MPVQEQLDRAVRARLAATRAEREEARRDIDLGMPLRAEPDPDRFRAFVEHMAYGKGPEAIQGDSIDFVDASFLSMGMRAAKAVAQVTSDNGRTPLGTGFLISPRLFITNNHVLQDRDAATSLRVMFEYELDEALQPRPPTVFALDPDTFFHTVSFKTLDFSIVAVGKRLCGPRQLADFGCCPLVARPDKHAIGMAVNIVQHPNGWYKKVVVRENRIVSRDATNLALHYQADTESGSSGSPVFNDSWEVIALHHWGSPNLEKRTVDGRQVPVTVNEGVRISAIVTNLRETVRKMSGASRELLAEAITRGESAVPCAPAAMQAAYPNDEGEIMANSDNFRDAVARMVVPLEISFRLGSTQAAAVEAGQSPAVAVAKAPDGGDGGAEKVVIDRNYKNRAGYDEGFLPGHKIPMPKLGKAANSVAPLEKTAPKAREAGLLDYEHFSLKLNKDRRMAFFTATNIDGATYIPIGRDTGLPAEEGGETWYDDPRVDADYFIGQDFYSANSKYFDRGHLTRRNDPTWGTKTRATRANADTFHRTNCTPQHWLFNESAGFWQGVERHYLEFGANLDRSRLCVFQGPVMNGEFKTYGDVRVPLQFWKIVARVENGKLKSTGFLVSQEKFLAKIRRPVARPGDDEVPQVDQFRVPVSKLESLTGLKFGDLASAKVDTFEKRGPKGAEAAQEVLITDWSDLV